MQTACTVEKTGISVVEHILQEIFGSIALSGYAYIEPLCPADVVLHEKHHICFQGPFKGCLES